jgi:hypothetical protein
VETRFYESDNFNVAEDTFRKFKVKDRLRLGIWIPPGSQGVRRSASGVGPDSDNPGSKAGYVEVRFFLIVILSYPLQGRGASYIYNISQSLLRCHHVIFNRTCKHFALVTQDKGSIPCWIVSETEHLAVLRICNCK